MKYSKTKILILGIFIGFTIYIHSTGILAPAFIFLIYIIFSNRGCKQKSLDLFAIGLIGFLIGGWQYLANMIEFGIPIHDTMPVWELEWLDFPRYREYSRLIFDYPTKIIFGVLRGFHETRAYGFANWVMIATIIFFYKRIWADSMAKISIAVISFYYLLMVITMIAGTDLVIKNPRYLLTIHFFVVYLAAFGIDHVFLKYKKSLVQ